MDINTISMALLDVGNGFTLSDIQKEMDIPYGAFAITLVNTDFERMRARIIKTVNKYCGNGFNPADVEKFLYSLYRSIDFYFSFSSKGFLLTDQTHIVSEMLAREIFVNLHNCRFDTAEPAYYIPNIISDDKLLDNVRNMLARKDTDLGKIIHSVGNHEIHSTHEFIENEVLPVYYLKDSYDYLLLDLQSYIKKSNKTVKVCECCGRMFLPTRKSDKYCRLPNLSFNHKTCNEIMKIAPNDEYVKARNKSRDKQHKIIEYYAGKQIYDHLFLMNLYDDWSTNCGEMYSKFKAKEDLQGYKDWIEETHFTKDLIEQKWEEYQKSSANTE